MYISAIHFSFIHLILCTQQIVIFHHDHTCIHKGNRMTLFEKAYLTYQISENCPYYHEIKAQSLAPTIPTTLEFATPRMYVRHVNQNSHIILFNRNTTQTTVTVKPTNLWHTVLNQGFNPAQSSYNRQSLSEDCSVD